MNRRRKAWLTLLGLCALLALLSGASSATAAPAKSAGAASGTPTPAPPVRYAPDGNACIRTPWGFGGGPGRDVTGAPGNAAVTLKLGNHDTPVRDARYSADGKTILTIDQNTLRLWDARTGRMKQSYRDPTWIDSAAFAPDGHTIALSVGGESVRLVNADTGQVTRTIAVPKEVAVPNDEFAGVGGVAYSPNGRLIAGARGSVAYVWDATTGREKLRLRSRPVGEEQVGEGHATGIGALRFSPNGQALLTSSIDNSIRMWDLATGAHLRCFEGADRAGFLGFDISPDGKTIAGVGFQEIYLWNALSGVVVREIRKPNREWLQEVAFSPDGKTLVTASADKTARLWAVATGALTGLMRHPQTLSAANFRPDGKRVITAMGNWDPESGAPREENAAWVWDVGHNDVAAAAKAQRLELTAAMLADEGDIDGAERTLRDAANRNPDKLYPVPGALALNSVCWFGALYGYPERVLAYCEESLRLDPENALIRDSRALARALTGDIEGAIEDYAAVIDEWRLRPPQNREWLPKREAWLQALQAGGNPFDEATLIALRNE